MVLDGPPVIGLGARGRDVAQQAQGAGLHVRTLRAEFDALFRLAGRFLQQPGAGQHLRLRHPVMTLLRLQADRLGAVDHRLLIFAEGSQHAAAQPVRPGVAGLKLQGLVQVAEAEVRPRVEVRLRPQHERLGAEGLEDDMADFHRRFARRVAGLEGEQHAALRIRLAEDLAHLVGDQHRLDLGQFELLCHGAGGKGLIEADDDRLDLAAAATGLDAMKRLDRVQLHHRLALLVDLLGRAPRLLHLLHRGHARRHAVKAGGFQFRRPGCCGSGIGSSFPFPCCRRRAFFVAFRLGIVLVRCRRRVRAAGPPAQCPRAAAARLLGLIDRVQTGVGGGLRAPSLDLSPEAVRTALAAPLSAATSVVVSINRTPPDCSDGLSVRRFVVLGSLLTASSAPAKHGDDRERENDPEKSDRLGLHGPFLLEPRQWGTATRGP